MLISFLSLLSYWVHRQMRSSRPLVVRMWWTFRRWHYLSQSDKIPRHCDSSSHYRNGKDSHWATGSRMRNPSASLACFFLNTANRISHRSPRENARLRSKIENTSRRWPRTRVSFTISWSEWRARGPWEVRLVLQWCGPAGWHMENHDVWTALRRTSWARVVGEMGESWHCQWTGIPKFWTTTTSSSRMYQRLKPGKSRLSDLCPATVSPFWYEDSVWHWSS